MKSSAPAVASSDDSLPSVSLWASLKDVLACQRVGFEWEDKGMVVVGNRCCHFGGSLNFVKVLHQTCKDFDQEGSILFIVC